MDVVILCGGKGTRLSEETLSKPKPMVEINGTPIIVHIMKIYSRFGYKRFILPLGYKGDYIKEYFCNYKMISSDIRVNCKAEESIQFLNSSDDWDITLVNTGLNSMKSERLKQIRDFIQTDNFHLTYGDGLGNINIKKLVEFHEENGGIGTVTAVHPPSRFGKISISENLVEGFEEKPQMNDEYINGGFFVFNKKIFEYLEKSNGKDLEFGTLKKLAKKKKLNAYKHNDFWHCMDNIREKNYLNKLAESGEAPWMIWRDNV